MLIICGAKVILFAQDQNLPGIIPSIFYRGRITNHFDYNLFTSATFITRASKVDGKEYGARNSEIYILPSLVYKYSKDFNVAVGYTFIRGNSFSAVTETEQQVWQQVIFEHRALKGFMLHRFRLAEGIKNNLSPTLNYQIAFEKPLRGRVLDEGEFYFTCFNESFINLSEPSSVFYKANWAFAGIGYKTSKSGKFEFGPLVQTTFINQSYQTNNLFLFQILWIGNTQLLNQKK